MKKTLLLFLVLFGMLATYAQGNRIKPWSSFDDALPGFITYGVGYQHSGYNSNERVLSNFSPLVYAEAGLYFKPYFAICFGVKGLYYLTIYDESKHSYGFFYANLILDVTKLIVDNERNRWTLQIYAGGGAFHNKYPYFYFKKDANAKLNFRHGRIMAAGDIGMTGLYRITNSFQLGLEVSGVLAWGLYRPHVDAIPGTSIKAVYMF